MDLGKNGQLATVNFRFAGYWWLWLDRFCLINFHKLQGENTSCRISYDLVWAIRQMHSRCCLVPTLDRINTLRILKAREGTTIIKLIFLQDATSNWFWSQQVPLSRYESDFPSLEKTQHITPRLPPPHRSPKWVPKSLPGKTLIRKSLASPPAAGSLQNIWSNQLISSSHTEKEKLHFMMPESMNQTKSNQEIWVFTANEVPWGAAPSARLYTYGQVTGVHRPRWGPDQRRRCRSQNLQQWAEGTRWKISHWKQKHETREPLDVILSLERLKPPTSTNHMLGVHAAFKALGARVCFLTHEIPATHGTINSLVQLLNLAPIFLSTICSAGVPYCLVMSFTSFHWFPFRLEENSTLSLLCADEFAFVLVTWTVKAYPNVAVIRCLRLESRFCGVHNSCEQDPATPTAPVAGKEVDFHISHKIPVCQSKQVIC